MDKQIIEKIKNAEKVYQRWGLGWKGAEWSETSKGHLIKCLENGNYAHYDIVNINGGLGISFYSANDML